MLSFTPVSLFCALLLCLPLAIVFTITTPLTPTTTGGATTFPTPTAVNKTSAIPLNPYKPKPISEKQQITRSNTAPVPPPRPAYFLEEDEPLLQLAARVNPNPFPKSATKKIAFMFLTTTPLPFAPIWELYFNQTPRKLYNIYVHADPSLNYDQPFSGVFSNRVIPSKPTRRYTPTLIAAARRLLAHALLHDRSNSMFALLSPSCVPLHSFKFTYKTLARSKKSFIEILKNEVGAYDRWAARGDDTMLPEVTFERFRIGSQFFILTRRHARIVVRDQWVWAKFNRPCLRSDTCYPEEHYFATLLSIKDPRGCVPSTLTHVDWRGSYDGHPRTYVATEVSPDLISSLRRDRPRYGDDGTNGSDSPVTKRHYQFLFARKFSPDSIQPLMNIAKDVIFKD